jgi:hypothetical protein
VYCVITPLYPNIIKSPNLWLLDLDSTPMTLMSRIILHLSLTMNEIVHIKIRVKNLSGQRRHLNNLTN